MKLQEQIDRIQEMMGVINETNNPILRLRRRMGDLDMYIKLHYRWLNPKAFKDMDSFIDRIVFSTLRDISVGIEFDFINDDDIEIVKEFIRQVIVNNYMDDIERYYYAQ